MSSRHVAFAFNTDCDTHADKLVLWCIAEATDAITGMAAPPQAWIAAHAGLSIKQIQRSIKRLEQERVIDIEPAGRAKHYRIRLERPKSAEERVDTPEEQRRPAPQKSPRAAEPETPPAVPEEPLGPRPAPPLPVDATEPQDPATDVIDDDWRPAPNDWRRTQHLLGNSAQAVVERFIEKNRGKSAAKADEAFQRAVLSLSGKRSQDLLGSAE